MGILRDLMMPTFFDLVRQDYRSVYAHALMSGTYEQLPRCPKCKLAARRRVPPLIIEWDYGSNVVGDFTWPAGLGEIIVSDRVRTCFVANGFSGVRFEPVEMVQKQGLKKPRKESKAKTRVWLPYVGPPLWNLVVTSWCDMDVTLSRRSLVSECDGCGRKRMIVHDPTAPLVVRPESWAGSDFFCIREMEKLVFISEAVRQAIEENGFTNVAMKVRGYIPETNGLTAPSCPS
jgi:hypothetical protein